METRLIVAVAIETALLAYIAWGLSCTRRDAAALLALLAGGAIVLAAMGPLVSLSEYDDYKIYLGAIGVPHMPRWVVYPWLLGSAPRFDRFFLIHACIAAAMPLQTYLVAKALGASLRQAAMAGALFIVSATFVVYGPGINTMTLLTVVAMDALLLVEVRCRRPQLRLPPLIAGALVVLGYASRLEGMFLFGLIPAAMLLDPRQPRRHRLLGVLFFTAGAVLVAATLWQATGDVLIDSTQGKVGSYAQRLVRPMARLVGALVGSFSSGIVLGVGLLVWRRRQRPAPPAAIPLLLPVAAYAVLYAIGGDRVEHMMMVIPVLLPEAVLALTALRRERPRIATALAGLGVVWILATTAVLAWGFGTGSKQAELRDLRGARPGSDVFYLPYRMYDGDPEAPLRAALDSTMTVRRLEPPSGCPAHLFDVLATLHARCLRDAGTLERCQRAAREAGPDWAAQAVAIAGDQPVEIDAALGEQTVTLGRSGAPADVPSTHGETYFFVPFWARARSLFDTQIFEMHCSHFPEFEWLEATRLALDLPSAPLAQSTPTLVQARVRDAADGAARCEGLAHSNAGHALFALVEQARVRRSGGRR